MRNTAKILAVVSTLALTVSAANIQAAGGGGGGGISGGGPSQSAPRYDATAEYQAGLAHLKVENYKAAIKSFKRSLSVASRNANAQYLLGYSYMKLENYKKARKPLEKAVKYNEHLVDARRDLAISYHKLSMAEKASAALTVLRNKQAACGETCGQKAQLDAAKDSVSKAMNGEEQTSFNAFDSLGIVGDQSSDATYLSAVSLINEGRYEAALTELDQAGREFGPHPDVLTYIGFANRKLGRFTVAEDHYQRALAVAPNHLGALEYYGELKVQRGDLAGANEHLARLETLCTFGCYEAEELRRWIIEAKSS
jgi:tetratricopeptide (TPR) repeat protein